MGQGSMLISNSESALKFVLPIQFQLMDKILRGLVYKQGTVLLISTLKTFITNVYVSHTVLIQELTILTITCLLTVLAKNVSFNAQPDITGI
jgi:hypothetical protein